MPQQHRFFADFQLSSNLSDCSPVLSTSDSHHLRDVLRLNIGDEITIVHSSTGDAYQAKVKDLNPQLSATLIQRIEEGKSSGSVVETLIFGLSKGKRNDIVCEKATELGVKNIILWQSDHSIVKVKESQRTQKILRWEKIILSAAKQSQQNTIPSVSLVTSTSNLLERSSEIEKNSPAESHRKLCGSLRDTATPLPNIPKITSPVQFVIGPEGDLSDNEQDQLHKCGFELVSLGPFTLRSETAAIVSIAMVEALWGFNK